MIWPRRTGDFVGFGHVLVHSSIVFQITPVDIPGPVNRRLERSLSVNIHQDMVSSTSCLAKPIKICKSYEFVTIFVKKY